MLMYFDFYFVEDTGADILDFLILSLSLSLIPQHCLPLISEGNWF